MLRLDTPTLFLVTVLVTFIVGMLFVLSWSQARTTRALAIWGVAHLGGAAASALLCLRNIIPDSLSIGLANAVMIGAYGLIWSGLRAFEGRPPAYGAVSAGAATWVAACLIPDFYASLPARVMLSSTLAGTFCVLGARELWRGCGETLASRYAGVVLMAAYGALYLLRVPLAILIPLPSSSKAMESPWLAILCFFGVLFTIAVAFVLMALTKERAEREQRLAAGTDSLTGIANRRAFVERAEALLADRSRPATLLLFDLDHFKAINDTYGHAVGDGVLVAFCHIAQALLPREAVLGRMGGEEFACLLPGYEADTAVAVADRVRAALGSLALPAYPRLVIRTSVGVATARSGGAEFDTLMRRADDALYRAKSAGRDRVETARERPRALAA